MKINTSLQKVQLPISYRSKFDHQTAAKIVAAIRDGHGRYAAAAMADLSMTNMRKWMDEKIEFREAVLLAEQYAESEYVNVLARAAKGDFVRKKTIVNGYSAKLGEYTEEREEIQEQKSWQAAAAWLRVRRKKEWGTSSNDKEEGQVTVGFNFLELCN